MLTFHKKSNNKHFKLNFLTQHKKNIPNNNKRHCTTIICVFSFNIITPFIPKTLFCNKNICTEITCMLSGDDNDFYY